MLVISHHMPSRKCALYDRHDAWGIDKDVYERERERGRRKERTRERERKR